MLFAMPDMTRRNLASSSTPPPTPKKDRFMTTKQKLVELAAKYAISIDFEAPFDSIELAAPEGYQFEPELHHLVTQRDRDNNQSKDAHYRAVLKDVEFYGPRIKACPADCPCKETID